MAQLNFDASTVAPQEAFDPIPAGWYPAQIVESEMKAGSKPGSAYLAITLQIMGGDFNNRKVFDRFNLQNANPVAVEIAYRSLSAVCHAVGLIQVADSQLLHGRPMMVKVSVRPARVDATSGTAYDASNEVKGYKALDASAAVAGGAPATGAPAWATSAAPAVSAPVAAPAIPTPTPAAVPAPAAPPAGWTPHPEAPGYFYQGQEVLTEAALRARVAPPVAAPVVAAPVVPVPQQPAFAAPVATPAVNPVAQQAVANPAQAASAVPPWAHHQTILCPW